MTWEPNWEPTASIEPHESRLFSATLLGRRGTCLGGARSWQASTADLASPEVAEGGAAVASRCASPGPGRILAAMRQWPTGMVRCR